MREFLGEVARQARGGVLITSRSREGWLGPEDQIHRLDLGGLNPEDVNELAEALLAASPRGRERRRDPAYPELLELLAGHPLSLRLILPRLGQVGDAKEVVDALRGETALPAGFEGGEGRLESLGACVHYSFRHLAPEHQERLPALTLFEGVADVNALGILSQVEEVPERFAGVERAAWEETLEACATAGLLTPFLGAMYRIHPALPAYLTALWQQGAGEAYEAERQAARRAAVTAFAALGDWLYQQIQGGDAATALAVLEAQRRSLGAAAAQAVEEGRYREAQSILQPLDEYWDARGLVDEAGAWVDRCRQALEDEAGRAPDLATPAGALWLFMVGSQANRLHRAGALDKAEGTHDLVRRTLEDSKAEGTRRHLAVAYHQLGMVAEDRGNLSAAEEWYRKSLEILESLGDRPGMAMSFHQLGVVAQHRGDLSAAEEWYRKSLEIRESLGNRPGMAMSFHQLGVVAQHRGDLSAAEEWYRKSLEIFESLSDRPHMAAVYHQLGMVAQGRGDLSAAEEWYRKSLEIKEALENRPGTAMSYHQLGIVAQDRGDLSAAEEWYRKSLEIRESVGDRPGMALTYGQLGLLAEKHGDPQGALDWTARCVALFPDFGHPATGPGPHHLARLTAQLGMEALEETWRRVTGQPLPPAVRAGVERLQREGES